MKSKLTIAAISALAGLVGAAAAIFVFAPARTDQAALPSAEAAQSLVKGRSSNRAGLADKQQSVPMPCPLWMLQQFSRMAGNR